jgi:thiol-disulfide isomerase/thioredoxin
VKRPGKLCAGQMQRPGRSMPESEISRASAPASPQLPAQLPTGGGKWTWVNFWAAWCVPCKEEIPRLKAWEKQLNQLGIPFRLVFVTLDDDARQLNQFLQGEREDGLRATYWLHEGEQREQWFKSIEMDTDPHLPAHLLVDREGKLRCVIDGAVEDSDYDRVVALLRG